MDENDYRGDAVTGEGGTGAVGGPPPVTDPFRGDAVTGEGGAGVSGVDADLDPTPSGDDDPEADGAG